MNKPVLIIVAVSVLIIAGFVLFRGSPQAPQESGVQSRLEVPAPGSVKEISMVSGDFFFEPKGLTLTKGQPVKIIFTNTGRHAYFHDRRIGCGYPA
ncbi:hypothetical protein MYX07_05025 [Patescibacteria group bacterium AH-259-L07]|nr:hypothetical protein [Patescibacteria group bacterium AH-259-L07]